MCFSNCSGGNCKCIHFINIEDNIFYQISVHTFSNGHLLTVAISFNCLRVQYPCHVNTFAMLAFVLLFTFCLLYLFLGSCL